MVGNGPPPAASDRPPTDSYPNVCVFYIYILYLLKLLVDDYVCIYIVTSYMHMRIEGLGGARAKKSVENKHTNFKGIITL